jgi:hypothetical protein
MHMLGGFYLFHTPHNMADQEQAQAQPQDGVDAAIMHYLRWALQSWNALARMLGIAELRHFRDSNRNAQWPFHYPLIQDTPDEDGKNCAVPANKHDRDDSGNKGICDAAEFERNEESDGQRNLPHPSHNQHANEATSDASDVHEDTKEDNPATPLLRRSTRQRTATPQTTVVRQSPRGKKARQN